MGITKYFGRLLSVAVVSVALQGMGAADCSPADLLHRWSFTGNYNDVVGGITATTFGAVSFNNASSPTAARVAGTAKDTAYIKLGAGIVPAETSPLTIEVWATQHSVKNWSRIFDFGSNTDNNLLMAWTMATDANTECVEIKTGATSILRVENSMRPYSLNVPFHISMTITPNADGKATLAWAKRDVTTGAILNSGSGTTSQAWDAKVIAGYAWNCLGRSQYGDSDADATYDEMRIWKTVLTAEQLTTSAKLGPDVLPIPADSGITHTLNLTSANGTVSVNGAAGVGTGTVTVPWSAGLRLTATPAAGYTFCRWEGDTQFISSGTVTSPEITIGTAQDITLTAVFDTAVAVYARYANGGFNYLSSGKGPVAAPEGGMNNNITILFSSDAEYQGLKTVSEDVAKAKGLELEANITLSADTDWTAYDYSLGGNSIDINGKHFTTGSLSGEGGITSDGNMIANGDFQADSIADGASVNMNPKGWKISGTVGLVKNNVNDGWYVRNGSNLCRINGGAYIFREFTIVQPGNYNLKFDICGTSQNGWWQNNTGYSQIDGTNIFNSNNLGWTFGTKSFTLNLGVGVHTLKIGASSTVLVDNIMLYKTSNAATTGVLEVKVPEGKTVTNDTVLLGGGQALQFWKTGKGTLLMNKENNGYGSPWGYVSTVVKEGLLRKSNVSGRANCGAQYSTIQVDDGGTYDENGRTYWDYHFILNGNGYDGKGALINTAGASSPWAPGSYGYIYNVTLGSDTTISGTQSFGMSWWNHGANTMTMNGHTVHYGGTYIYFGNMSYSGKGRIVIDEGCTMESYNNRPSATGCTLEVRGQLQLHDQAMTISNLVFTATGTFCNAWDSRPVYTVYDTYAPNLNTASGSKTTHPNVELGTANSLYTCLDLSLFTSTFDAATTTFYTGTSVKVELGAREVYDEQKLVSWSAIPNVADFIGSGENFGDFRLQAREDGLYVIAAPTWAVFDLINECWQYFRSNGEPYGGEWTEGITDKIDVHFSSFEEFNAIKTMGVTPAKFVLTKLELPKGTALYDFTDGFDFTLPPSTVIDLKGNHLKLPSALIGGTVPFTVTDSTFVAAEPAESPAVLQDACLWLDALDKSTMTIDGAGRVTRWTSKDAKHVVASATSAPTYKATEYSIPTVDFGGIGSGIDMTYNSFNNLRTVFWVMQIAKGEGAFFLGDSANYNFHRGAAGQYGNGSYHKYASMWNGLSGVDINGAIPPDDKFCVYSATMNVNAISDRLTTDRNCTSSYNGATVYRSGGRQLSELICFNTVLSDADRRAVVKYLQTKWFSGGELIVDVPEGQSIANNNVTITSNVRFVKAGAGTLTANKAGQSYTGGTKISAGVYKVGNNTCMGANGGEITVEPDGILEMNGKYDLQNYNYVLAGGTLQNTVADVGSGYAQISNVRLTADSTFKPTCSYGLINGGYTAATLDLAGHTLTVPIGVSKNFWFYNVTVTEGTIDLTSGGTLQVDKTVVNAPNTTFRVNCALGIAVPFTVGSYEGLYSADYNGGTAAMTVNKVFKPHTAYYYGVTLADGVTLDLSAFSGVFTGTSSFQNGAKVVTYPAGNEENGNAKLYVELHGRALTRSQIIAWDPATPPPYLDFERTERTKRDGRVLEVRGDGVYVLGGTVLFFR